MPNLLENPQIKFTKNHSLEHFSHNSLLQHMKETKTALFTVIFDFDSTCVDFETNDELFADLENVTDTQKKEIEILTDRGLDPTDQMDQPESMKKRFDIANPQKSDFEKFGQKNKHRIPQEIKDIIAKIRRMGGQVLIVSGGNKEIIDPLLEGVIPAEDIYANNATKYFETNNVDDLRPIDKREVIGELKNSGKIPQDTHHKVVMVGDGGSDLEVFEAGLADIFIHARYFADRDAMNAKISQLPKAQQSNIIIAKKIEQLDTEIFSKTRKKLQIAA